MERLAALSARVPRYTSYPTAPHFNTAISAEAYSRWLVELPRDATLSLYLHIPFCDTLCWFCGCHTRVVNHYAPVAHYLGYLAREIERVSRDLKARRVTHVHWGGGSPTLVGPDDIRRLGAVLRDRFDIATNAEFAIEIDPRGLTDETIASLAGIGVNRASIGVQDLDPKVQWAINRLQPFTVTASAAHRLRAAGIDRLNVDLLYGLPHQTTNSIAHDIRHILTLAPDRLAIFGYAHVPQFKKHQELIDAAALPDVAERKQQFELAHQMLAEAGYRAIGLDHFALPDDPMAVAQGQGRLRRNFQGYTTDAADALIGFGASAIGALPRGYVQNVVDPPAYCRVIESGSLAAARGLALSDDDRLRRTIIERLMCDLRVDLDAVAAPYGRNRTDFAPELDQIERLERDGFVELADGMITVPPSSRAAVRLVCAAFDAYLARSKATHAMAV